MMPKRIWASKTDIVIGWDGWCCSKQSTVSSTEEYIHIDEHCRLLLCVVEQTRELVQREMCDKGGRSE